MAVVVETTSNYQTIRVMVILAIGMSSMATSNGMGSGHSIDQAYKREQQGYQWMDIYSPVYRFSIDGISGVLQWR